MRISQESVALICCCIGLYQFKYLLNEFLNHIHYRALTRFYFLFSLVYICMYYRCPATGASYLGSFGRNVLQLRWELQACCLDDFIHLILLLVQFYPAGACVALFLLFSWYCQRLKFLLSVPLFRDLVLSGCFPLVL